LAILESVFVILEENQTERKSISPPCQNPL
jgi:hypothetical protein